MRSSSKLLLSRRSIIRPIEALENLSIPSLLPLLPLLPPLTPLAVLAAADTRAIEPSGCCKYLHSEPASSHGGASRSVEATACTGSGLNFLIYLRPLPLSAIFFDDVGAPTSTRHLFQQCFLDFFLNTARHKYCLCRWLGRQRLWRGCRCC